MRRLLLLALLLLCPAIAWAADGDLVDAQAGPAPGTWTQTWKLLDAQAVVDPGQWIYYGGFTTGSVEITGISGDSVTVNCTNAVTKPPNATVGTILSTVTANGYSLVSQPCRWIKAAVTIHGSGTVSALLTASASGGGGGGTAAATQAVTQSTNPWLVAPDGTSWSKTGTNANVTAVPTDASTGSTALGASNAVITVNLAGQIGAVFQLESGGTGAYVVTPECSFDGGTTYPLAVQMTNPSTGLDAPTVTITSGQARTDYTVVCPFGASNAQVRVSAYTSGTANWLARATTGGFPSSIPTLLTGAPTVSSANSASTITLTGVAGHRICVTKIVVYATSATGSVTLDIKDGATIVVDYGTIQLQTLSLAWEDSEVPIMCGSTGNSVVIDVGAGSGGLVTHTSVVADHA